MGATDNEKANGIEPKATIQTWIAGRLFLLGSFAGNMGFKVIFTDGHSELAASKEFSEIKQLVHKP